VQRIHFLWKNEYPSVVIAYSHIQAKDIIFFVQILTNYTLFSDYVDTFDNFFRKAAHIRVYSFLFPMMNNNFKIYRFENLFRVN
jgi:hypothetical protein